MVFWKLFKKLSLVKLQNFKNFCSKTCSDFHLVFYTFDGFFEKPSLVERAF